MYVCMSAGFFFFVLRYGCWLFPHEELLIFFFFFAPLRPRLPFLLMFLVPRCVTRV